MRTLFAGLAVALLITACSKESEECISAAFGSAFRQSFQVQFSEAFLYTTRPEDVRTAHGQLWISGAHEDGRLLLMFGGPIDGGTLPRTFPAADGGCELNGDFVYHLPNDGGAADRLNAMLRATHQARTDAGARMLFGLTGMRISRDGGARSPTGS